MSCGFCREGGPYARFGDLRMRIGRAGSEPRLVVEHRGPEGAAKALMPVAYCPVCGAALSARASKKSRETSDGWEQLGADLDKHECQYFGHEFDGCDECPARDVTPCFRAQLEDVSRRAKALIGRGG